MKSVDQRSVKDPSKRKRLTPGRSSRREIVFYGKEVETGNFTMTNKVFVQFTVHKLFKKKRRKGQFEM